MCSSSQKKVLKAIAKILNKFLWNGAENSVPRARVSWKEVCCPKREGGLGLKWCEEWSKAAIMRSIWLLFKQASFLWVAWVRNHLFKNQSFWQVKVPQQCWGWMKILKIQELVRPSINFQVGDGSSMFFYNRMVLCTWSMNIMWCVILPALQMLGSPQSLATIPGLGCLLGLTTL